MKKITYFILILTLGIGVILMTGCTKPDNPPKVDNSGDENTENVIDQTDLLYSATNWAGLCGKEGRDGGCYWGTYLYTTGKLLDISGFMPIEGKKEEARTEKQLTPAQVQEITKKIQDSGIMKKYCKMGVIMDAGWDYEIDLNGEKKTYRNPPEDCNKIFGELNSMIEKYTSSK